VAPSRPPRGRWTYAKSGVDRSSISTALTALIGAVRYRPPPAHGVRVEAPGHYAGLLRVGAETIAVTTDTVGTKVLLADRLGRWEEVGEDIVGVNVNDLAAVGARTAGIVDTILCARPDARVFRALGRGIDRGLAAARCSLLGGETAVVPDIVHRFDLGATAFGFFPGRRRPVLGDAIRAGDPILGIPSHGAHANGYTLIRRILDERKVDLARPRPGARRPIGRELLQPTRIYTEAVDAIADLPGVHGLAHMSGGGVRNLVRLNPGVEFVLHRWPTVPPLFRWLQEQGGLSDEELFQTFNAGVGFVVVVDDDAVAEVTARLAKAGAPDTVPIGRVGRGEGVTLPEHRLEYRGYA
jgi:phosphoribosylformylglycinamidine cyclo-ligase